MSSIINVLALHEDNPLPMDYIGGLSEAVELLVDGLKDALSQATMAFVISHTCVLEANLTNSERSSVSKVAAITTEKTGKRGRPRKVISEALLREAFKPGRNISVSKLASSLPVHRNTVKNYMLHYKITRHPFSTISNSALDTIIRGYKDNRPNTGIRYIRGFLFNQGIRVQRERIVASLRRVDDVAGVFRRNNTIKRREYKSSRPNALWHVDGHHKLGPWGVVIHGFTDGYDRVVGVL